MITTTQHYISTITTIKFQSKHHLNDSVVFVMCVILDWTSFINFLQTKQIFQQEKNLMLLLDPRGYRHHAKCAKAPDGPWVQHTQTLISNSLFVSNCFHMNTKTNTKKDTSGCFTPSIYKMSI
jgi:hypothetical protein